MRPRKKNGTRCLGMPPDGEIASPRGDIKAKAGAGCQCGAANVALRLIWNNKCTSNTNEHGRYVRSIMVRRPKVGLGSKATLCRCADDFRSSRINSVAAKRWPYVGGFRPRFQRSPTDRVDVMWLFLLDARKPHLARVDLTQPTRSKPSGHDVVARGHRGAKATSCLAPNDQAADHRSTRKSVIAALPTDAAHRPS